MTAKHFEIIAQVMKAVKPKPTGAKEDPTVIATLQWERTINAFAASFKAINPRFKKEMFLKACGI